MRGEPNVKTVILCGGRGTRLSEETSLKPKPMVTVGGQPILWHILSNYSSYGFNDFVLALGYKGDVIKEYFLNYHAMQSNFRVDLDSGKIDYARTSKHNWIVELIDTGNNTMTGGRLRRLEELLRPSGTFFLTYGDGVASIPLGSLLDFHRSHRKLVTVSAVRPLARFGGMTLDGTIVKSFKEKSQSGEGWINGGFFVMEPEVFDYLKDDQTVLEGFPMEQLARDGELAAFQHAGFWHCMDTVRDRETLEELWNSGEAPWKVWNDELC